MDRNVFLTLFVIAGIIMLVGLSGFVFGAVLVIKEFVEGIKKIVKGWRK